MKLEIISFVYIYFFLLSLVSFLYINIVLFINILISSDFYGTRSRLNKSLTQTPLEIYEYHALSHR